MWRLVMAALARLRPGAIQAGAGGEPPADGASKWPKRLAIGGGLVLVLILGTMIWWFGPRWQAFGTAPLESWVTRLLASLSLLGGVAVIWGIWLARRLRGFDAQRRQQEQQQRDPCLEPLARQEVRLNRTLSELSQVLGGGADSRYRLPWYLVLGVENAGKTSLINRSCPELALTRVLRASGQANREEWGFDWWISGDRAVLIDPDGELLTQGALQEGEPAELEQRRWKHFVAWLARSRPRRPLDGVVLVIDMQRLNAAEVAVRQAYAALLRARLRELMEQHGSRLPIYVTFSKMDLLKGFEVFCRYDSRVDRQMPFGVTFSADSLHHSGGWEAEFSAAYDELLGRLNQALPRLLADCRGRDEREAVFSFIRQLAGLRDILEGFLKDLLSGDRFSTEALVRGVYFTSVYQQGVPDDPFVEAAARRYGMSEGVQPAHRASCSTPYFVEALFERIIYREAGLAGDNARAARRRLLRKRLGTAAYLVVGLVLFGGWGHFYQLNSDALAKVEARVTTLLASDALPSQSDAFDEALLVSLDRLREAREAFGGHDRPLVRLTQMGLYQGHKIGRALDSAYLAMLEQSLLPALMRELQEEMRAVEPGSDAQLVLLRQLRMLSDASGRQAERVMAFMQERWQHAFPLRGDVQRRWWAHLEYALAHSDLEGRARAGDHDAQAVMHSLQGEIASAQRMLALQPMADRVYATMKAANDRPGQFHDLRQVIGTSFNRLFRDREAGEGSLHIPLWLTRVGFENDFPKALERASETAWIDAWVLGQRDDIDFSAVDRRRLEEALRDRYASDYQAAWRDVLSRIELVPLQGLSQALEVTETLVGASRPLERLLNEIAHQTRLNSPLPTDDEAVDIAVVDSPRYRLAEEIQRHFAPLTALRDRHDDHPSRLDEIELIIGELHEALRRLAAHGDLERQAFLFVRDDLALPGEDPIARLRRSAEELPAPLAGILRSLADQSRQLLTTLAVQYLERQWRVEVVEPFQDGLAGRYPLAPQATREVALADFEGFFASEGILDAFYRHNLQPFIEGASRFPTQQGEVHLGAGVIEALQRAEQIRRAYLNGEGGLEVAFDLEPLALSSDKRRALINVDGQLIDYTHGVSRRVPLIWPNGLRDDNESRLTLVPNQVNRSPRSLRHHGPWAWFRLLDQAQVTGVGERELELRFTLDGGNMRYRLSTTARHNPFTRPLVAGFQLPGSLYVAGEPAHASDT
ncbi:type VI secretion system membrane subunit TssM [Halomonas sp. 328]|uniref:type VI secretion system membrane subunit TssM n=1 Tax=Halomonas sp. 328 TaxID=2776704 RepID=UPI0018A766AA|nr:type VI secretion system membrane subunit TssM [Halomonas sp. 328]MBF8224203.1 type VI secretion system membrane subunit TssM [Halomonas sp. 328]